VPAHASAPRSLSAAQQSAVRQLLAVAPVVGELGRRFEAAGHELALVGGPVRDALMDRLGTDWDFATSARPDDTERIVRGWADAVWDMGRAYGTIGCRKGDYRIEITTYRSDTYDPDSRKPQVDYGDTLEGDLSRRDFTVNAMAVRLPEVTFVDPFGGLDDLASSTPSVAWTTWLPASCVRPAARSSRSTTTRCGCCGPLGSPPGWDSRSRRRWSRRSRR